MELKNLDINLNLYKSFYYVAKYGGFTNASKHIYLSQSSLSSNIIKLESLLNKKMFNRNFSDITLTDDGKILFLKLEEIIKILDYNQEKQYLNIGCVRFIADNYLDDIISKYKEKYRNIKISIIFENATELYHLLKKDEIDILICRYPLFYKFEQHIFIEKITNTENVFACSKTFFDINKLKFSDYNYVYPLILPNSSEKRRTIEQYLIDNDIKYTVEVELPSSNLLKKLILNNSGIGFVNKKFIKEEIESGEIVVLEKFKNVPNDNITVMYNSTKENHNMINFIQLLNDNIDKTNS